MQQIAFEMKLKKGFEAEYKKRHDEIWPELSQLLKKTGISDYSIFLNEESGSLFGVLKIESSTFLDELPKQAVMQKWWKYMEDIMETNVDHSPVAKPLMRVFYLP